jgi:secreted trypsin-like serine protease
MIEKRPTSGISRLLRYYRLFIAALTLGIVTSMSVAVADVRIINGHRATPGDWPWMVHLWHHDGYQWGPGCGGTLISKDWVLTAAHCVTDRNTHIIFSPLSLQAIIDPDSTQWVNPEVRWIDHVEIHPNYDKPTIFNNDIALLHLVSPSHKLPLSHWDKPKSGTTATVIGYGVEVGYGKPSKVLNKVDIHVFSNSDQECLELDHRNPMKVTQNMFCAGSGYTNPLKSTCNGDSGGPIMVRDDKGNYAQIGIVSWGDLPCDGGIAAYTRLSNYVSWIEATMGSIIPPMAPPMTPSNNGQNTFSNTQVDNISFSWPMPEPTIIYYVNDPFYFYPLEGGIMTGYGNYPVLPGFLYESHYADPLQGVIFRGGMYTTVNTAPPIWNMLNPFGWYRQDAKADAEEVNIPNWYPSTFFNAASSEQQRGKQNLLTAIAGQYNPNLGQQRIFTNMDFEVYHSSSEDKIGPLMCITKNDFNGTTATIEVDANDASDVKTVVVAYTDGNSRWSSVELTASGEKWVGSFAANATTEFFVQIVDNTGNVAVNDEDGKYFKVGGKLPACKVEFTPTACHLYAVNDRGLNNSQFFTIAPDSIKVSTLGTVYNGYDIEALAIHPQSGELYAASGDNTGNKGHLYQVDKENGQILDLGATPCKEVDALSFHPDGTLWAWGQDCGLFRIDDPLNPKKAELIIPSNGNIEVEDITWNTAGMILYGVENLHNGHNPDSHGASEDSFDKDLDFDKGVRLWAYYLGNGGINTLCDDFMGSLTEIEAMETLPDDSLIFGFHGSHTLTFGVVNVPTCQMAMKTELTTPYNDVEGIAWPTKACVEP